MARTTPTYTPIRNYAVGFFLSVFLLFSDISYGSFTELRGVVKAVTLHLKMSSNNFIQNIGVTYHSFQESKNLIQENEKLKDEIKQIKNQDFIKIIETSTESAILYSLENIIDKFKNNIYLHKIASIDLKNYLCCSKHRIFLQNPQKIQIKKNLPVIAGRSFIGQTSNRYLNLIEVILFSDVGHVLPIKSNFFYCNARGEGKPLLISCALDEKIDLFDDMIGDSIHTSGLGGIFMKDIEVGFISDISSNSAEGLKVEITLIANPLEENFYGIVGNITNEV